MLDLKPIKQRIKAAPELEPYATAKGGVVLLNGPFPYAKAYAAVELVKHAPADLAALILEVERLRAALQRHGEHSLPCKIALQRGEPCRCWLKDLI